MVNVLYDHNTPITLPITITSLHVSIALYITHIKFTYTVTRLTSTLIKSVRCYRNDYHENNKKIQHMHHHQRNYYMYTMY